MLNKIEITAIVVVAILGATFFGMLSNHAHDNTLCESTIKNVEQLQKLNVIAKKQCSDKAVTDVEHIECAEEAIRRTNTLIIKLNEDCEL